MPDRGEVYLDTMGFIYSVERIEPYRSMLEPMWRQAQRGRIVVATSELTALETLVKPLREGDPVSERMYRAALDSAEVRLIPATRPLWEEAARLRAETNLKAPDALHAASALMRGCSPFITNDSVFKRVNRLSVLVLDDFVEAQPPAPPPSPSSRP